MIQEIHIFLQSLNLDAVYFLDPGMALLYKAGNFLLAHLFSEPSRYFFMMHGFILFLSFFVLLRTFVPLLPANRFDSFLYAVCLLFGLYWLDGTGLVYLDLMPLVTATLGVRLFSHVVNENLKCRFLFGTASLLLLLLSFLNAGPLAFFYALISLLFCGISHTGVRFYFVLATLLSSLPLTFYFSFHSVSFDYPAHAKLAPLSSLAHLGNSFIGPERLPFPILHYAFFEMRTDVFRVLSLLLVPGVLFGAFFTFRRFLHRDSGCWGLPLAPLILSLLLGLILCLSSLFSSGIFIESPEAVLFRLVPGLVWRPYPFFLPAVVFLFSLISLYALLPGRYRRAGVLLGVLFAGLSSSPAGVSGPDELHTQVPSQKVLVYSPVRLTQARLISASPSRFFLDVYGTELAELALREESRDDLQRITSLEEFSCAGDASVNREEASLAFDGSYGTRWSTKGPQKVGDWYELRCTKAISARRIILSVLKQPSDFPRGVRVEAFFDGRWRTVLNFEEWFGPALYTDSGLPYFGDQGTVSIDFPESVTAEQFRFTLRRGDSTYDWSIAEIIIFE